MNTRRRQTEREYVLLLCGDYFRDELEIGVLTPRQERRCLELRRLVFDALGNLSMADAERIKRDYLVLKEKEAAE